MFRFVWIFFPKPTWVFLGFAFWVYLTVWKNGRREWALQFEMVLLFYFHLFIPNTLICKLISALLYVAWEPLSDLRTMVWRQKRYIWLRTRLREVHRKSQWLAPAAQELLPNLVYREPRSFGTQGRGQSHLYWAGIQQKPQMYVLGQKGRAPVIAIAPSTCVHQDWGGSKRAVWACLPPCLAPACWTCQQISTAVQEAEEVPQGVLTAS